MPYISPPRKVRKPPILKISIKADYNGRNTQSTLLSADTTFSSGLRRIRSSQVSLSSLLDAQSSSSQQQSSTQSSTHPNPLSTQHNMLTSTEDLTKFPSESLHSFSFSQPRDPTAILESRQNVLRKSIDYMKDKLHGSAPPTPWAEQALTASPVDIHDLSKDEDVLQSLKRGNLIPEYWDETNLPFPTAPLAVVENPFDALEGEPLTMRRKKRTSTDLSAYKLQAKLFDVVTKPYSINMPPTAPKTPSFSPVDRRMSIHLINTQIAGSAPPAVVPVHTTTRLAPTMQAIFSTEAVAPWKILNANDLACLEFAVGEQDIKRGVSILDCFEQGRREWVQERLEGSTTIDSVSQETESTRRDMNGEDDAIKKDEAKERVVLCGEVVSMRKMKDDETSKSSSMAASLWVKEKAFSQYAVSNDIERSFHLGCRTYFQRYCDTLDQS
jgi:protein-serine/threonine kinase